jgi:hypothetical protein
MIKVVIIQTQENGVDKGAYRYVIILTDGSATFSSQRCFASNSLFDIANHYQDFFKLKNWPEIEGSLIKVGAWIGQIEMNHSLETAKLWQHS